VTVAEPPKADAVAAAAQNSPVSISERLSELADLDELRFREEIEPFDDPTREVVEWIDRKQLVAKLDAALRWAAVEPRGTVVDLGAGTCWMSALLSRRPSVERVIAIEFSRRRLLELAPVALAHLNARAGKVERVVADFYEHGLGDEVADLVMMDAAFHHAADPVRLADVAYRLLKPGGVFFLHREPTLSLLRRSRPHGLEGDHGEFEHEYFARQYLEFLDAAGFEARKSRGPVGFRSLRERAHHSPPFAWLNGVVFSEYSYAGVKPRDAATS
jgi:SAM-dependent methyltransferase